MGKRGVDTKEGFDDVILIFLIMVCITLCHVFNISDFVAFDSKMIN